VSPLVPKAPEPDRFPDRIDVERDLPAVVPPTELVSMPSEQAAIEERHPDRDPAPVPDPAEVEVPTALRREIERAMKRYPEKHSAAIPALWAVQRRYGWCTPEGITQAAAVMGITPAYLQAVASFYDLFHLEPAGAHEVLVCTNIACFLRGADRLLDSFCAAAGTGPGGTSEDGQVFVRGFECLGACDLAPMASIDQRYYGPLEPGDAETAVEQLRSGDEVLPSRHLEDRGAAGGMRTPADPRITSHPLNKPKRPRPKRTPSRRATKAPPEPKSRRRR
jgi:NADH-quinone oxidoreductase subunit E